MTTTKAPHPSPELPTRQVCAPQQRIVLPSATRGSPGTDAQSQHNHTLTQRRSASVCLHPCCGSLRPRLQPPLGHTPASARPRFLCCASAGVSRPGGAASVPAWRPREPLSAGPGQHPDCSETPGTRRRAESECPD